MKNGKKVLGIKIVKKIEDQDDFNASAVSPGGWCCSCCCWCWAKIS
ncbi:hypothetical protein LACPH_002786 [Lacticaseibacillus parahuelsenbergensis]|uniref:Bacteriocin n=1 Tax=Lacticaseibacillus parahuelsenbergensis TaxID=3068305 RepID=A0ABY9L316_9LACO|nr:MULTISPECIES: hypothetical protein [Lacticaseibacillus]MDE3283874.1 hypothetical protein [Lacticaseibacillus casei]WLV78002.1 hypothetical protein LACPH_002786 [Lacticaseibacillus sp. NCIMB 15471]